MKKYVIYLVIILISCKANQIPIMGFEQKFVPSNGFEIEKDFFVDRSEIRNIDWKEYHHWIKRIFGKESIEYSDALPDTLVWQGYTVLDTLLIKKYYRSADFDNFPVVGITQSQAMKFSKWRSDRVFEMMLIESRMIDPTFLKQNFDNYFTIERYLSGNFFNYKPDTAIKFIPKFSLPTSQEVEDINKKVNENIHAYFENCKKKYCRECKGINFIANSLENHKNNHELYSSPTRPSNIDCLNKSFLEVHNLIGNVSEWTIGYLEIFGGSWKDEIVNDTIVVSKVNKSKSPYIGFRNICKLEPVNITL